MVGASSDKNLQRKLPKCGKGGIYALHPAPAWNRVKQCLKQFLFQTVCTVKDQSVVTISNKILSFCLQRTNLCRKFANFISLLQQNKLSMTQLFQIKTHFLLSLIYIINLAEDLLELSKNVFDDYLFIKAIFVF